MKNAITAVLALVGLVALIGALAGFYGFIDIAADRPEPRLLAGFFEEAMEHTVARRVAAAVKAGEITVPDLADPAARDHGLEEYEEMCVTCHGAPGRKASVAGQGLNPPAPELNEEEMSPEELFWILEHGIRYTGMPAFGPTHSDETLWAIVAFLQELPQLDEAGYERRLEEAGLAGEGPAGHEHAAGTPPHEHAPSPPAHEHAPGTAPHEDSPPTTQPEHQDGR